MCVCEQRWWGVSAGGVLGDLLPWPIKWGFAFDSVLKETDEPAELHYFPPRVTSYSLPPFLNSCKILILLCLKGLIFFASHVLSFGPH